ncbi:MAG: glycosyltransferase N-terminal domain-containing protein [Cyclobacteriaceae bacterium]|nr:glycosyltransferase N-terminal domain-containing protein [Cyclobacteriaceae bacterium]
MYFIYLFISPFLWGAASLLTLLFPKMRERTLAQRAIYRKGIEKLKELSHKPILLFHAASTGEFEQLKPLLPLIDKDKYTVIVTFFSATVYRKEKNSTLFDMCFYHPLDSLISAVHFFSRIKPTAYIVNRHDLWPSHLWVAKLFGIKTIFINANVHESSKRNLFSKRF